MATRVSAALLLVVLVVSPVAAAAPAPLLADAGPSQQTATTQEPAVENTTFYLQLQPDGNARWTITDTYALDDENDSRAFEELGTQYVDGEIDAGWEQVFRDANAATAAATGRQMDVTDVQRDYVVGTREGTLVLEFTWTNFATTNGNRLIVQDAFNTSDGTWLPRLYDEQTLVIAPPPGYGVTGSPPTGINDGQLRFEGPQTFDPGYLDIVYRGNNATTPGGESPGSDGDGSMSTWIGVVALLVGLVATAAYLDRRGQLGRPTGSDTDETSADTTPDSTPADTPTTPDDEIDVELLSDEERVERLLDQNGGRMKQARIVKETGWSNAKVSQLLSSMDEADRIDKLRIGRENLISFPDEDVTEIDE